MIEIEYNNNKIKEPHLSLFDFMFSRNYISPEFAHDLKIANLADIASDLDSAIGDAVSILRRNGPLSIDDKEEISYNLFRIVLRSLEAIDLSEDVLIHEDRLMADKKELFDRAERARVMREARRKNSNIVQYIIEKHLGEYRKNHKVRAGAPSISKNIVCSVNDDLAARGMEPISWQAIRDRIYEADKRVGT